MHQICRVDVQHTIDKTKIFPSLVQGRISSSGGIIINGRLVDILTKIKVEKFGIGENCKVVLEMQAVLLLGRNIMGGRDGI